MYNNAPEGYKCPICLGVQGVETEDTLIRQSDIIYKDDLVTAFIGSFFIDSNPGYPIIVPNKHFENIYELPANYSHRIADVARYFTIALKEVRKCDGITILQNNEPASNQHAFHYHMHVYPRFKDDGLMLNITKSRTSTPDEREIYAEALKQYLTGNPISF